MEQAVGSAVGRRLPGFPALQGTLFPAISPFLTGAWSSFFMSKNHIFFTRLSALS